MTCRAVSAGPYQDLRVALLVDGLANLEDVLGPSLFAIVEHVEEGQVLFQQSGVALDLVHHGAHAVAQLEVLRRGRALQVQGEVIVQLLLQWREGEEGLVSSMHEEKAAACKKAGAGGAPDARGRLKRAARGARRAADARGECTRGPGKTERRLVRMGAVLCVEKYYARENVV